MGCYAKTFQNYFEPKFITLQNSREISIQLFANLKFGIKEQNFVFKFFDVMTRTICCII